MIPYNDNYKKQQGPHFAVFRTDLSAHSEQRIHTNLHYHSDMELLLVEKGETTMQVGGETFSAKTGSFILVNPYEVHGGQALNSAYSHRCICFDLSLCGLPDSNTLLDGSEMFCHHILDAIELAPYFHLCYQAIRERPLGWELQARGNLLLLFSHLTEKRHSSVPTKEQTFLRGVLDYLEAHFAEDITSATVAQAFSYEHSYFCRKFRRLFGQSFTDFLHIYQINRAKELLLTHSITATAALCGFASVSYFSRVFKAVAGISPSRYCATISTQAQSK